MDILTDKQYKSYNYFSRYTGFPFYYNLNDNKYIYGTTAQLRQNNSYALHKVKKGESFDSIALDYYNNPTFFWVICDFNKIQDPYIKLEQGEILKIPVLSNVTFREE